MEQEMQDLEESGTYDLTTIPKGRNVVGGRWVYAVKPGPDNTETFKARYVAKGFLQVKDVDYQETFSPTAKVTSIRMLMQLAAQESFIIEQMDVKSAYLNAEIDCELYIEQPMGFEVFFKSGEKLVCRLNKSLYGLKQSGRNWNNLLICYKWS